MNLKKINSMLTIGIFLSLVSATTFAKDSSPTNKKSCTQHYEVSGMTCGGCVFGVSRKLKGKELGLNPDNVKVAVGTVDIAFMAGEYKGSDTDKKITEAIANVSKKYVAKVDAKSKNSCLKN